MNRSYTKYHGDEVIDQGQFDVTWEQVRIQRNAALQRSDWRALKDVTLSAAWKEYRQALRDLPGNHETANDAADAFPEAPE